MNNAACIIDNNTIHVYDKSQFDWYAIRNSGQIFCDPPCKVVEESDKIVIECDDAVYWFNYFDLYTDYNEIRKELMKFEVLREPIKLGGGIRILRQPFVKTVISFIISANNNIKRFSKTIEQIDFENLGKYSEQDFKQMGCGYRAPYLVKAVRQLKEMDASELGKLDNTMLLKQLLTLAGVGRKVAECIMLFAFHRLNIAPVDVHIKKAIEQLGKEKANSVFNHKFAGIAQQYIFYYLQHFKKELL